MRRTARRLVAVAALALATVAATHPVDAARLAGVAGGGGGAVLAPQVSIQAGVAGGAGGPVSQQPPAL